MASLKSAEEKKLSDLLLDVYTPGNLTSFRARMLVTVERIFGGEIVCHNEINIKNGESLSALCRPIDHFAKLRPAFFEHVEDHPSIQHLLARNGDESEALKTSDFVSQRRWRSSGLYSEFYKPLGDIRYQLTIGHRAGDWLIFFAVSRMNCDFTEEERALLTRLRPHFVQAYQHAKCHTEMEALRREAHPTEPGREYSMEGAAFAAMQRFGLTRREADVLLALADGKRNAEIADCLHISLSTVKTHLQSIFERMGAPNRAAALRIALDCSR